MMSFSDTASARGAPPLAFQQPFGLVSNQLEGSREDLCVNKGQTATQYEPLSHIHIDGLVLKRR